MSNNTQSYDTKYKGHLFSRYFIVKEGLFKNTKKLLNIYNDSILIENIDESEREIINFEDIVNIVLIESNLKDFKITYRSKNGEVTLNFSSKFRTQVVCDLLRQIDLFSKVNKHPVESLKCFMFFEDYENVMDNFKIEEGRDIKLKPSYNKSATNQVIKIFDITLNLYRSVFEWIPVDSKRELRMRLSDIENVKVYDHTLIKLETYNKIDLNLVPRKIDDSKLIVEKLIENCKNFLGYDINIEYISICDFVKISPPPKTKLFSFDHVYRLLYNSNKIEIKLVADFDYLYEIYETTENAIKKIVKIPIHDIIYLIMYESEPEFIEIVLKTNARFLYQTSNTDRNVVITHLIDLISNYNENDFLLLSSKPTFGMRITGFPNDEVDWEYEKTLLVNLSNNFNDVRLRENIVEDICLNFCFRSERFKHEAQLGNKKVHQHIYDLIPVEILSLEKLIKQQESPENKFSQEFFEKIKRKLFMFNNYLILSKNMIIKFHSDKLISDIMNYIDTIKFQTIFFNSISVFRTLIPITHGVLKKDELAQRKWMISSHFDNAIRIKNLLFSKIFEVPAESQDLKNKNTNQIRIYPYIQNFYPSRQKIQSFENKNILSIYILMELQKNIYQFSRNMNIIGDILKEFNDFDFLYILYMLMRCDSNLMKQISIEVLLILLRNLSIDQEYQLKNMILSQTFIFIVLINIYINSANDTINGLALKFLKSFLISHVEATNLMMNLFPMTLFYHVDKRPNPINWLDHEWDNFFKAISRDHNKIQLIWNGQCRNELSDYLNKVIEVYEYFADDSSLVLALHLESDEKEIAIKDDGDSGIINLNSSSQLEIIRNKSSDLLKTPLNCSFYCCNYKEIKVKYPTLKQHTFVWQYYLKKLINETGRPIFTHHIEKPKKFWNKLKDEIIVTFNENKIILIIKTMTLLYKIYFDTIGVFKEYQYFMKLFSSTKDVDIKIMIIQLFTVTVEIEEKEIKEENLKKMIEHEDNFEIFINFCRELIDNDYLKKSIEKKINFDDLWNTMNSSEDLRSLACNTFLDNKNYFIQHIAQDHLNFDKNFPNYTNYIYIDNSWISADKKTKAATLIIKLLKILLKRHSIVVESIQKISVPIPKIKSICSNRKNYIQILPLLLSENENLVVETLDLILNFLNDPINYKYASYSTNLIDILVYYMMKYKSKVIMKYLENLYYYHSLFFNFDFLLRNELLNEDEIEFVNQYPNANKFLLRYFPINLIYYYMTTDFVEFIKILNEDNYKSDFIWNKTMFEFLVTSLKNSFYKCVETNNSNFNENFKVNYEIINKRNLCFLYYLDIYLVEQRSNRVNTMKYADNLVIEEKSYLNSNINEIKKIENSHVTIVIRCLMHKIKRKISNSNQSVNLDEELFVYLKSFYYIMKYHDFTVSKTDCLDIIKTLFHSIIAKEKLTQIDLRFLNIILKIIFASVFNISNDPNCAVASEDTLILFKSLSFFIQRFFLRKKESENYHKIETNLIKIFSCLIEIFKKNSLVLENIDLNNFIEINQSIHKILFLEMIHISEFENKSFNSNDEENESSSEENSELNDKTENLKFRLINIILDYFFELSKTLNTCVNLINNALSLEIIYFCLKFEKENSERKSLMNQISKKSFAILKNILKISLKYKDDLQIKQKIRKSCKDFYEMIMNTFQKQFFNDFNSIIENDENLSYSEIESEINNVLTKLKSNWENPEFIWNEDLRNELMTKIYQILDRINSGISVEYLNELKSFKYASYSNELKIGNIYIKLFNKEPHWILPDSELFLNQLKDAFIEIKDLDSLSELLNAISNTINFSKVSEMVLLSDEKFIEKFNSIMKVSKADIIEKVEKTRNNSDHFLNSTITRELSFRKNSEISILNAHKSDSERIIQASCNSAGVLVNKLIPAGLNFLQTISNKSNCLKFILSSSTFFILIKIFFACNSKECLDPILKIMRNTNKNSEFIDKINLSMFLFLLKKIIFLKETINKTNKDSVNSLRIEILKIIKRYIFNEKVGFAIKGLFEFYLPLKIIENLFSSKDVTEQNLTWIDSELELPDLIWNFDAISQSKKLLEEDIDFILNDEENFENFPQNLFSHKLNPLKNFFFEITDEFRIDNLYLRIFNKDPSYNIRKNLIIFLKHILSCQLNTLKDHIILNFYFDNLNTKTHLRLAELVKQKFTTCLTAICLIIEQIDFNDFNDNLAISSAEEMKIVIKDEEEKNLINLIQRSFEYQKLLSVPIIKKILSFSKFIFGLEISLYNSFLHFDNNIRLVYLQIVYLICLNKNGINLISDNFDVITIMEKMHNNQDKIGDFEFVVVMCILYRIISNDISQMSRFLTRLFDKYVDLSNKRIQLLKFVQLIFCKIINDTHYGESLINSTKNEPIKYKNFSINLAQKLSYYDSQIAQIWRKGPDSKEQANIIYRINHQSNFVDESIIKSSGTYHNFEGRFPFLPKLSITYFNINDIINEELSEIMQTCVTSVKNTELVTQLKKTL